MDKYEKCEECKQVKNYVDTNDEELIEWLERVNYRPTDKYLWALVFLGACWFCITIGVIVIELWGQ